jgi:hypothetical protein
MPKRIVPWAKGALDDHRGHEQRTGDQTADKERPDTEHDCFIFDAPAR